MLQRRHVFTVGAIDHQEAGSQRPSSARTIVRAAIAQIPARVHMAWDYVCRIVFGAAVTIVWAAWAVMTGPVENHVWLNRLSRWLPLDYVLQTPLSVFVLACVVTSAGGRKFGARWRNLVCSVCHFPKRMAVLLVVVWKP